MLFGMPRQIVPPAKLAQRNDVVAHPVALPFQRDLHGPLKGREKNMPPKRDMDRAGFVLHVDQFASVLKDDARLDQHRVALALTHTHPRNTRRKLAPNRGASTFFNLGQVPVIISVSVTIPEMNDPSTSVEVSV